MRSISGLDRDLQSYLQQAEFHPVFSLDPVAWQREVLEALYFLQPLVVVARGKPRAKKMLVVETVAEMSQDEPGTAESMSTLELDAVEPDRAEYQVVGSILTWALPWQEELEGLDDCEPSLIRRPTQDKTAYLHWLGIKLNGPGKAAWPSVTASTVLLARISIELMRSKA